MKSLIKKIREALSDYNMRDDDYASEGLKALEELEKLIDDLPEKVSDRIGRDIYGNNGYRYVSHQVWECINGDIED